MNVLLIRHAESNGNASGGDYSVHNADALSPKGMAQAEELGSCLESWEIGNIIVSPQQRALQTIVPYLATTSRTAEVWPELAEACWHEEREPLAESWGSRPASLPTDIAEHFFFRDGKSIQPGPPHSFGAGLRRVYDAIEMIETQFSQTGQTVILAAHGYFIREMINAMLKLPDHEPYHHDNCGMTLMTFDKTWNMEFCNRQLPGSDASRTKRM